LTLVTTVDHEALLVLLEEDARLDRLIKHHLRAVHIIVHAVLHGWHEGVLIHQVKLDSLCRNKLKSDVAFGEVNEPNGLYIVVQGPFSYFSEFINFNLVKV
jgi:hypothetical protein